MGGYGSGRRKSRNPRPTVEECVAIDVNKWNRLGLLEPGQTFTRTWRVGDEPVLTVAVKVLLRALELSHAVPGADGGAELARYDVPTYWTPCRFGGQRPWLHCPFCGRRVVKLYLVGRYFRCRRCGGLAYASQREDPADRARRRANKIRERLGGLRGPLNAFPPPPPRMRWATYARLVERAAAAEAEILVATHEWGERQRAWLAKIRVDGR